MTKELGDRQVAFDASAWTFGKVGANNVVASDIFEDGAPKRNEETATYFVDDSSSALNDKLIAYVPEEVCEDLDSLYGKELTVVFGEDNVVALIAVTDDAVIDNELITNINLAEDKITIDGTEYKYLSDVEIYVNNIAFGESDTQLAAILNKIGVDTASTRTFTKAVKANVILNAKEKVERIDLTISGTYFIKVDESTPAYTFETDATNATDKIEQFVVEEVKSKGNVIAVGGSTIYNYKDLIEAENEPRVLKAGTEIAIDEIEEGDVLTIVSHKDSSTWDMETIYVSSEKVTGELERVASSLAITVGSEKYYATVGAKLCTTGDLEDATTTVDYAALKTIDGEEVEVYLNILGEYVAIVAETSSVEGEFGVIKTAFKLNYDENNEDEEYRKIKVLLPDGSTPNYTVKYDKNTDTTKGNASKTLATLEGSGVENELIKFKANADKVIMIDDIEFVKTTSTATTGKIDGMDVKAITLGTSAAVNHEDMTITDTKEYDFSDAIFMSYKSSPVELNVVDNAWDKLVEKTDTQLSATAIPNNAIYVVEDDSTANVLEVKLVYIKDASFVASDVQFAIVKDIRNNRDESDKEIITLENENGEVSYEVATSLVASTKIGNLVQFQVTEDEVTAIDTVIDVVELNNLDVETAIPTTLVDMTLGIVACDQSCSSATHDSSCAFKPTVLTAITSTTLKEHLVFEYDEDRADRIYYVEDGSIGRVNISDDGAVVINLTEMDEFAEGITFATDANLADLDGEIIIAIDADTAENGAEILVVIAAE